MGMIRTLTILAALAAAPAAIANDVSSPPGPACSDARACLDAAKALAAAWRLKSGHPLTAKVYRPATLSEQTPRFEFPSPLAPVERLFDLVKGAKLPEADRPIAALLIGEQHDNADHHAFQAVVASLFNAGLATKSAFVFEQLAAGQRQGVAAFEDLARTAPDQATLAAFKRHVDWEHSGWASYNYDLLLQAVLDARLTIYAGDVLREAIRKVAKEGPAALDADERRRLGLDVPLGAALDDASLTEIEASHCGAMPKSAFAGMAFAQRYRDAHIADVVLTAAKERGVAVLFAGNEHVRTDRGVPWYIRQRAPDRNVISLAVIEVEEGKADPEAYVPRGPDGKPAADYVVFTPKAERGDPCAALRARKPG